MLVITKAAVLEEIAAGKLDVVKAFLTGKIKVEGNMGKAALLKEIPVKSPAKGRKNKVPETQNQGFPTPSKWR